MQHLVASMDRVRQAYAAERADLQRQKTGLQISDNEYKVFGLRLQKATRQELGRLADELGSAVLRKMVSADAKGADVYARDYWRGDRLNASLIDLHAERIGRALIRANRQGAEAIIQDALNGPKEAVYGLWRCAGEVARHPDGAVRMLAGRAENALHAKLASDETYQALVERQNAAVDECHRGVRALYAVGSDLEIGGASPYSGGPLGQGAGVPGSAAMVAEGFTLAEGGRVRYRSDPRSEPMEVGMHQVRTAEPATAAGPLG